MGYYMVFFHSIARLKRCTLHVSHSHIHTAYNVLIRNRHDSTLKEQPLGAVGFRALPENTKTCRVEEPWSL